jgi:drug/metabolite transporter (DMT)-like permease
MNDKKKSPAGYLLALGATAIWSGNFIIARGFSGTVPPVSLAFWRWSVALLVLLPFTIKAFIGQFQLVWKHKIYLAAAGFLGVSLFNTLVYIAGSTTTAMNLSLISITFPVIIVVLSRILFGDKIPLMRLGGIILVLIGVVYLITRGELSVLMRLSFSIGDVWMLVAALAFAVYSILLRKKPAEMDILVFQLSTFIIGLLLLAPFYLWETSIVPPVVFDVSLMLVLLYVGVFASLTAFLFWNKAVSMIGPSEAGLVYYTLPLFSGILSLFFLGESIGIVHLVSSVLIIGGILMANGLLFRRGNRS